MTANPFRLSVNIILRNLKEQILLLRRSESCTIYPGFWDLPGGKINLGENIDEAISREVGEETAQSFEFSGFAGATQFVEKIKDIAIVIIIMEGNVKSETVILSNEHDDYVWINPHEVLSLKLCPHFRIFFSSYVK